MGLLVLSLAALAAFVDAQPDPTITYRVTLRSFLPSHCLLASEFIDVWSFPQHQISDVLYNLSSVAGINGVDSRFDLTPSDGPSYGASTADDVTADVYCPYWAYMRNGTIRPHPDFETASEAKRSGASQCYKGGVFIGCSGLTSVIKPNMTTASSGLRKVQYCTDDPDGRCGSDLNPTNERFTTSRGRFFDYWYNDDPRYSKRVGDTITLGLQSDGTYYFNDDTFFPLGKFSSGVTEASEPDPDRLKVWPNSLRQISSNHYLFTTELHTYFEYRGDELFRFRGDDDVWVWINGKIAIDLGSTHPPEPDEIFLNQSAGVAALNLTVGEIYSFDMFHAERHYSQSNFRLTTTLSTACNVIISGSESFALDSADPEDIFIGRGSFFDDSNKTIMLTAPGQTLPFSSTSAYVVQQQNVGAGFVAEFDFVARAADGIEGFAFVLHSRPDGLTNLPQSTGANLGFKYLSHSLAVVFDMCADRLSSPGACKEQNVRLHYPTTGAADFNGPDEATRVVFDGVMRSLHYDDEPHTVRIEFLQRPAWLEVYIDDSLYLRKEDFSVLDVLGGRNAYVGFTTATGANVPELNVSRLSVTAVLVEPLETLAVDLNETAEPKEILGDGEDFAGFSLQTRDFCKNELDYGGYRALMKGYFVPLPELEERRMLKGGLRGLQAAAPLGNISGIVPAEIIDNGDGTYTAALASTDVTRYALYACFGAGCDFNLTDMTPLDNETGWYGSVPDAISVRALTPGPTTSPTVPAPTNGPDTGSAVLGSAIGGGSALFVLIMVGGILFILRRRWQRDRAFIEEGALYNMEREVTYDKNDEYSVVGRMVLSTTAAIQRERAQKAGGDGAKDADALAAENAELQEQIRINKQKAQEQQQAAAAASVFRRGGKKGGKKKKEFQGDMANPQL